MWIQINLSFCQWVCPAGMLTQLLDKFKIWVSTRIICPLSNAKAIAVWNSIHTARGYFPVNPTPTLCTYLPRIKQQDLQYFDIHGHLFLQYLTFLSCWINQIYHLHLWDTFIWNIHSLCSFVLVCVQIQVSHSFACYTYTSIYYINTFTWIVFERY